MIPSVVASESGTAQTGEIHFSGVVGPAMKQRDKEEFNVLERTAGERESRVDEVGVPCEQAPK